jgi:hypothetical protein
LRPVRSEVFFCEIFFGRTEVFFNSYDIYLVLRIRDQGIRCLFDPWIRDPVLVKIKIRIRDEYPDHISESLETVFCATLFY